MTTPYERLAIEYAKNPREQTFSHYVVWHLLNGFVFSTPKFFVMGRAINKGYCQRNGVHLWPHDPENADTWYLFGFAGDMTKAWSILPYPLPYIAWERMRDGHLCLTVQPLARIRGFTDERATNTRPGPSPSVYAGTQHVD